MKQLTFEWDRAQIASDPNSSSPKADSPGTSEEPVPAVASVELDEATLPVVPGQSGTWDFIHQFPHPTQEALDAGVIDLDPSDFDQGSQAALKVIHDELRQEWLYARATLSRCLEAQARGVYPETDKPPRTEQSKSKLKARLDREIVELEQSLEGIRSVYIDVFGFEAADAFFEHLEAQSDQAGQVASQPAESRYPPNHPWYYLPAGDAREPVPASEIPGSSFGDVDIGFSVPKDARKRAVVLEQLLRDQQSQLDRDITRYEQLIEQGAAALSDYDRNIAYSGNDEMALASAFALKYSQIAFGKGRVEWLRRKVEPRRLG